MKALLIACSVAAFATIAVAGDAAGPRAGVVRVVGPDQQPVEGASVFVRPDNAPPGFSSTARLTGKDGTVRFEGLSLDVRHSGHITPPQDDEGIAEQDFIEWLPGAALLVALPRGRTIRGVTIDGSGRPCRAIVHLRSREPFSSMSIPSAEHGEFEFRHRPIGPIEIIATPDFGRFPSGAEVPDDVAWTVVAPDSGPIRLAVTDVPPPVIVDVTIAGPAGATPALVRLEVASSRRWGYELVRGGRVTLTLRSGDEVHLRALGAVAADGSKLDWAPTRAELAAGEARLRIDMPPGRSVAGRVVDDAGAAMAGVVVLAMDLESSLSDPISETTSSVDGRFRLSGLGDEEVAITTRDSAGFAAAKHVQVSPGRGDVVIVVRPAVASRIRIVDPAGVPVADADVTVMEMTGAAGGLVGFGSGKRTGPDGSLDLPAMDAAIPRRLLVRPPSSRDDLAPLKLRAWLPHSGDITLSRGYVATLRVLDEEDRPVAARVARWTPPPDGRLDEGGFATVGENDKEGAVRVRELPVGRAFFRARPLVPIEVFPAASVWTSVDDRHKEATLRVARKGKAMRIRTDRGSVAGLVGTLYADIGGPTFDTVAMFEGPAGSVALPLRTDPGTGRPLIEVTRSFARDLEFSDAGTATVPSVAPGAYSILLALPGADRPLVGRVDLASFDGADVVVPLVEPATIRVAVAADGPVEELFGHVEVAGQLVSSAKTVDGRSFLAEGLPPGRYQVRVSAKVGGRRMGATADVEAGAEAHVTLVEDRPLFR